MDIQGNHQNSRKKVFLFSIGIILLVVAGYVCYDSYRRSFQPKMDVTMKGEMIFSSQNPAFNFSFEYPEVGWKPRESQGRRQKYDSLYLQGPVDKINGFSVLIAITAKPLETMRLAPDLLDAYLKTSSNLKKFKVLSRKTMDMGGEKGFSAIFEQEILLPRESINAKPIRVRQQTLFLVKNGKSYEITLLSTQHYWSKCLPVFEHVLKTFKFKD